MKLTESKWFQMIFPVLLSAAITYFVTEYKGHKRDKKEADRDRVVDSRFHKSDSSHRVHDEKIKKFEKLLNKP